MAPQLVTLEGVAGKPIGDAIVWSSGDNAIASRGGFVTRIAIDRGSVVWDANCGAPVVGVTANAIVCGDERGTHALGWSGNSLWDDERAFVAIGDRVVVAGGSVLDAATGKAQFTAALPDGARVLAACDQQLFAIVGEKLVRFAPKQTWAVATAKGDSIVSVDACADPIVATVAGDHGTALVAIARDGKLLGRVEDVRGVWFDATGLDVATKIGVTRWDRALAQSQVLDLPPLGALIAQRGDRALIRATATTAIVLDPKGIRALVALPERAAALGEDSILAGGRLFKLPVAWKGALRLQPNGAVMVPAELRDLPPVVTAGSGAELALGTTLADIAIAGNHLYAATDAGVAELDLATLKWGWHVAATATAIAASAELAVYTTANTTVALALDGAKLWEAPFTGALTVAGDTVLVGGTALDAKTGAPRGAVGRISTLVDFPPPLELPSHDEESTGMWSVKPPTVGRTTLVISYERNRVVARVPSVRMMPVWSVEVDGVVASLQRVGDGVLVALEDGDAYRIDAHTGGAVAVAGVGLGWRANGDAITGEAPGGPIPGVIKPPVTPPELYKPTDLEAAPAIATPWPPPPAMPASWQLTVYTPSGGLATRNDYAVASPRAALRTGTAPFVYVSGDTALVVDPANGAPLRRVALPGNGLTFSTIVDGRAVVGTILAAPLRAVVF